MKKNDIKHLVIEKVDRHVRNLHDAVETHDWLMADEKRYVHFVKDSLILHKNSRSQEWLNWGIRVVMAKNYIDNLREEAMKGWAEKLAQGWMPAPPPVGYKTVLRNGKRIHEPDSDTYKSIQKIFRMYLQPDQTIETITQEMARMGLVSKRGRPFSESAVHVILKNPFYIGIIQFNGKEYPGSREPLIPIKLYKDVQTKLHRGRPIKMKRHNNLLKGMVTCGHCGKTITWQQQKGRLYGACQRDLPECRAQSLIREEDVVERIEGMLDDLISPSQMIIAWLTDLLRSDFKSTVNATEEIKKNIDHRIARIKQMDDMLYDDKLAGLITSERYLDKHKAFISEIKELEAQKGGVSEEYEDKYAEGITIIELTQTAKQQFLDKEVFVEDKRSILTKLFEKMTFKNGIVSVNYTKLAQAIATKSAETREIFANAKTA